jgi:lambda family phage portal protein
MNDMTPQELDDIESLVGTPPILSAAIGRGGYDGASRMEKQIAGWRPPLQSADVDMLPDKGMLDARSRDLGRNDAYVQAGANLHKDSIVGAFYVLNSKPAWEVLGRDEAWAEAFQKEVETKFTLWAESPHKWVDASRQNDFTGLIRLAVGVTVFSGEALATVEWPKGQREYNTAIQMIDTDRLATPEDKGFDPTIRGGIRMDSYGAPVSAFIRTTHTSDYRLNSFLGAQPYKEVKWRKPWGRLQVLYLREQQRVDQTRAVSDIAAGLREIAITRKFRDVTLQKAVLAATYAATIESELPSNMVYEQLGSGDNASPGEAMTDYATEYLTAINQYTGSSRNMLLDGIKIPHLYPGTKLNFQNAGAPQGVGQEFEQSLLRYVATALGVSYEELSRDYTKTNYSSARAAMANTWKFMQSRKRIIADGMANAIFRLWLEEAINKNRLETFPASDAAMLYTDGHQNMMFEALAQADWIGAARGQIDELKETQAAVLRIKYGLSTHEDELARLGKDWRKTYAQLEREKTERDARGIELLEDNSVNAASGSPRDAAEEEKDGTETKDDA